MKKAKNAKTSNKQEISQTRFYDSRETMRIDAEQFVRNPDAFTGKLPRPRDWRLKVRVMGAVLDYGNPPETKHKMTLTLEVEGSKADIDSWQEECRKMFTPAQRQALSSDVGRNYLERTKNAKARS